MEFKSEMSITSIVTMGKQYSPEFVQEYKIYYGFNGGDFTEYKDREGNSKVGTPAFVVVSCTGNPGSELAW